MPAPSTLVGAAVLSRWTEVFDPGLFNTQEEAFASNAHFRYWHMVGVKDAPQECLVGQAGEIEPVYDEYTGVQSLVADGKPIQVSGRDVWLPAGTTSATITYY